MSLIRPWPMLALLLLAVAPLSAPVSAETETEPRPTWADINRALLDGHVIPRYQVLAQASTDLSAGLDTFCRAPDAVGLRTVRGQFITALDAWNGIAHIVFGPIETEQRLYRFQLWPDKRGTGQKQVRQLLLAADPARLEPAAFTRESVAVQGLSALEVLLFPADEVGLGDFTTDVGPSFRCRFATAIGHNLADMADATLADWTRGDDAYRQVLLQAGSGDGRFADQRAVSGALLQALSTGTQLVHQFKLQEPLGTSAEAAKPRRAESWRSRRSLANVCTNLRALGHLYATGFAPRLAVSGSGAATDRELALTLTAAESACLSQPPDLLDDPLNAGQPGPREALEALRDLAGALQTRTGRGLAEELDLPLGFNSLDGD